MKLNGNTNHGDFIMIYRQTDNCSMSIFIKNLTAPKLKLAVYMFVNAFEIIIIDPGVCNGKQHYFFFICSAYHSLES